MTLRDLGNGILGAITSTKIGKKFSELGQQVAGVYKVIVDATRSKFNELLKLGGFDVGKQIDGDAQRYSNPITQRLWINRYAKKHLYHGMLIQGQLYYFTYDDPLTKDKLAFYDTTPLVLSFGLNLAGTGNFVEYGINLHMLPMQVRKAFLIDIFNMFAKQYKDQMYSTEKRSINEFSWETLQSFVNKYSISFAVRSYIPERRKNTVMFDYADWGKAISLPSAKFVGITDAQLMKLYKQHVSDTKFKRMSNK
jgi:hypothetical protein